MPINWPNVIAALDAEISRLQRARKVLAALMTLREAIEPRRQAKKKRTMSADARARISAAQKKRWAQQKKATK
jgi:hypothetical protein